MARVRERERESERPMTGGREKWPRVRKGLKGNEGKRKTDRVVPLVANEYLINLLAWMYLISSRRGGTRALKGSAKSRGSSYHRANPSPPRRRKEHFLRVGTADAVIGLELQRELSYTLPAVAGFLFTSSGGQSRMRGKTSDDDEDCKMRG